MKKILIFLSGVLTGGLLVYWLIGYSGVDTANRGGFAHFIAGDALQKYKDATFASGAWIKSIINFRKSQDILYDALVANIQRSLAVYYEGADEFPESLDAVIKKSALPGGIRFEYERTAQGYTLRLLDAKTGSLIKEFYGSAAGL